MARLVFLTAHEGREAGDVVQLSGSTASDLLKAGVCAFAPVDGSDVIETIEVSDGAVPRFTEEEYVKKVEASGFAVVSAALLEKMQGQPETVTREAVDKFANENDLVVLSVKEHADLEELATGTPSFTAASAESPALKDALLRSSATTLDRLPDDVLRILATMQGIDPLPEKKADLLEALKATIPAE